MSVEKVKSLIRKALSTSSEEEARTCALTAVRLIAKEELDVVTEAEARRARGPWRFPKAVVPRRPADAPSRTGYNTICAYCLKPLPAGSKAFWSKALHMTLCPECFEDSYGRWE